MATAEAASLAKLTTFCAIAGGAFASVGAGFLADRIGKAETTIVAMGISAFAAIAAAIAFYGSLFLLIAIVIIWGASIIADSAQFSALVADYAPPQEAGALLTLQTALGFALTTLTVQVAPFITNAIDWPGLFIVLAIGPIVGILAMLHLRRITEE